MTVVLCSLLRCLTQPAAMANEACCVFAPDSGDFRYRFPQPDRLHENRMTRMKDNVESLLKQNETEQYECLCRHS